MPNAATIILQIHRNKLKTDPIHTIINMYRRPHHDPNFTDNLRILIDSILTKTPRTSITIQGDININLFSLSPQHPLTQLLLEHNLHTTITTPTRYDPVHNTASLIDTILTTLTDALVTSGTLSPPLADHLAIYAAFETDTPRIANSKQKSLSIRQYEKRKHIILPAIEAAIIRTQTDADHNTTTAQHFNNIQKALQTTIEQFERKPNSRKRPWCSPKFARQIQKQHKLYARRLSHPTPDNIQAHAQYRNQLNKAVTAWKRKTITEQLAQTEKDPKVSTSKQRAGKTLTDSHTI